ncbi:MAG TPA: hypothetical protein VK973_09765 [Arenicellales bacterium]|nr:hypothetical protein [Arenicellales bacterium]
MSAVIKLTVNSGAGVLASVVSRLQAAGVRIRSHSLESLDGGGAVLTLHAATGAGIDEAALRSALSDIDAVRSVDEIDAGEGGVPTGLDDSPEIPGDLVERLVSSFPRVMTHLQAYQERIAGEPRRADMLKQLGIQAGRRFASAVEHGPIKTVADVIDDVVLPGIGSIAEASRNGEAVVVPVSLFTRRMVTSMDLLGGDDESCDFLCGFIQGLASSAAGYESLSVAETRCRARGDPACVFAFT